MKAGFSKKGGRPQSDAEEKWSKKLIKRAIESNPQICDAIELDYENEMENGKSCEEVLFEDGKTRGNFERAKKRVEGLRPSSKLYRFLIVGGIREFADQLRKYGKTRHHETGEWANLGESWSTNDDFNPEDLVTESPTDKNSVVVVGYNPSTVDVEQTLYRSLAWTGGSQNEVVLKSGSKIRVDKVCEYFDRGKCEAINKTVKI